MTRILIMSIVSLGALLFAANPHSNEWGEMAAGMRSQTEPHTRVHAKGKTTVHSSDARPYDQAEGLSLIEINISETFTGDIDGESTVRSLKFERTGKSASQVSMQRFSGKLGGRQGTFVLQGSENVENGKIKATWLLCPDPEQVVFLVCAARAGLKAGLGKGPTFGWIIGSNDRDWFQKSQHA